MRTTSDELLSLLERLATVDSAQLASRRESWKQARDERRALIAKHSTYLDEMARRRDAEARAAAELERAAQHRARAKAMAEAETQRAIEAERAASIKRLKAVRLELETGRDRVLERVNDLRLRIQVEESALVVLRKQLAELQTEVDGHARRISEIDRELALTAG